MNKSYCEQAELDCLRRENQTLMKELDRANGELSKARSDIAELKDLVVRLAMRCVQ